MKKIVALLLAAGLLLLFNEGGSGTAEEHGLNVSALPASVMLPPADAVHRSPPGRPSTVTVGSVSAVPSYVLPAVAAVNTISVLFSVTSSVPSSSVTL